MVLKGDTGLFREALFNSGLVNHSKSVIFNDKHKHGGRRLKLWFATGIFDATQRKQQQLESNLRKAFGARIEKMWFSAGSHGRKFKSLCIKLHN